MVQEKQWSARRRERGLGLGLVSPPLPDSFINVYLGQAWGRKVGRAESSESCPDEGTDSWAILRAVKSEGCAHTRLTDGGVLTDNGSAPGKESGRREKSEVRMRGRELAAELGLRPPGSCGLHILS